MLLNATPNFSIRFREERQDLSATATSLTNLLFTMLLAGWLPYLCFTDTFTVTVIIALLSWCLGRPAEIGRPLRNRGAWHLYTVHLYCARTNTSLSSFIAQTSREWNYLSCSVCQPDYELQFFKRQVNDYIMTDLRNLDKIRPEKIIYYHLTA